jgi:hypothetical protein
MPAFTLPHFPSTESLCPDDAPLRADAEQYAASHGARNLTIIHALADKDKLFPNRGQDPKADPLWADEIIQLLANQGERRRRHIHDEESLLVSKGLAGHKEVTGDSAQKKDQIDEGVLSRSLSRRRELHTYGKNSKFNTPLAETEFPMEPWSPLDEQMLRLAAISDRGDFDYTGRVDRKADDQIEKDLEMFFQTGVLPEKVSLALLNSLFGTLHALHVFETNAVMRHDWKTRMPTPIPLDADSLIQVVRIMRLEHSIAPERTKIVDLLVCGITLHGQTRISTNEFDHLTDTLQNTADNAHEDDLVPVRFIALGHRYRHTVVAQSCMYNFPRVNEAQVKKVVASGNCAFDVFSPPAVNGNVGFDVVKSFEAIRNQLDISKAPLVSASGGLGARKSFEYSRDVFDGDDSSQFEPGFHYSKSYEAFRTLMDGFESPTPEAAPTYLLTTDAIFAQNPDTKPGPEPFLLSRSLMMADPQLPPNQTTSRSKSPATSPKTPHPSRLVSELPTGKLSFPSVAL